MAREKSKIKNPDNVFAGRNLKYFMECNGITKEELADSLGIEKESILKILNGTNAISGPYNAILLREYNCDLNFIYGGMEKSDMLTIEYTKAEKKGNMKEFVLRTIRYLLDILEKLE